MSSRTPLRRTTAVLLGVLTTAALLPSTASAEMPPAGGTGPYDAEYVTHWTLRDHTGPVEPPGTPH